MPFELSESLKNTCGMTFASRGINGLFCSKIYTSAILTLLIIVLIMILYPGQKGTPFWMIGKLGVYIFITTLVIVFIHDGVVYSAFEKKTGGDETESFIAGIGGDANLPFKDENHEVRPNVSGGYDDNVSNQGGDETENFFRSYGV